MIDLHSLPFPRFCYLEIPATDPRKSAEFYKQVFGWNIRRGDSERPSFDDPSGVSGAFVTYLKPGQEPGILPSIWVKDIESFVARIAAHGGEIVERRAPTSPAASASSRRFATRAETPCAFTKSPGTDTYPGAASAFPPSSLVAQRLHGLDGGGSSRRNQRSNQSDGR